MKIEVSQSDYECLQWLAANWYVVKGNKPKPVEEIVSRLIRDKWRDANPPEYQTSGFERL